jgi:AmmeMemoRadiSam system protein B
MTTTRPPAVSGQFYPAEPGRLRTAVNHYIEEAGPVQMKRPKAIIAPHAGYVYSGPIAGSAYARLAALDDGITKVILLGPAHWAPVRGLAASSADAFATPLGPVTVDRIALSAITGLPQLSVYDEAHAREHGLEVHLPFLQVLFKSLEILPLVVGDATADEVVEILDRLWGGPETIVIISSDLSHYHDYRTARRLDRATATAIEELRPLSGKQACGLRAINGLLLAARQRGMTAKTVDLRNSGDTAGPRDRVVGYGAFVFQE